MSFKIAVPEDKLGVSETGLSASDYKMSMKLEDADDKLGVSGVGLPPAVKEKSLKCPEGYQGLEPYLVTTTEDGREVLQVRPFCRKRVYILSTKKCVYPVLYVY
jgi:hypothetical protein